MSYHYECPEGHTNTEDNHRRVWCFECQESYAKQSLIEPTAISKLRTSADYLSPKRWSASHDLIHFLTPYEHFDSDPWDDLKIYKNAVESLPSTQATFKFKDVHPSNYFTNRQELFGDLIGAWRMDNRDTLPTVWVNPYYGQYELLDWEPDEHKIQHWLRLGLLGRWSSQDMCDRFDVSQGTFYNKLQARGFTWSELRDYGRKRVANTVLAAVKWKDHTIKELSTRLDMSRRTLTEWTNKHGDFDADPPSSKPFSNDWG